MIKKNILSISLASAAVLNTQAAWSYSDIVTASAVNVSVTGFYSSSVSSSWRPAQPTFSQDDIDPGVLLGRVTVSTTTPTDVIALSEDNYLKNPDTNSYILVSPRFMSGRGTAYKGGTNDLPITLSGGSGWVVFQKPTSTQESTTFDIVVDDVFKSWSEPDGKLRPGKYTAFIDVLIANK